MILNSSNIIIFNLNFILNRNLKYIFNSLFYLEREPKPKINKFIAPHLIEITSQGE